MMITAKTKIYGVVGNPVRHSLSPLIHNHWLAEADIDAVYTAFELNSEGPVEDLKSLNRFGVAGLNVTVPYKHAAMSAATMSEEVMIVGAANTLSSTGAGWKADNTDTIGFILALRHAVEEQDLTGANVTLIGAGGAARAAVFALGAMGVNLTIANRTPEKAVELADSLNPDAQAIGLEELGSALEVCDIAINATSAGHGDTGALELPEGKGRLFMDLSYGHAAAANLSAAQAQTWKTEDGLRMLVEQARRSFEIWHDISPDPEPVLIKCREAIA